MFWPDTGTGVDSQPVRKPVQSAVRRYFTEGGVGVPPTVPGGDWFNQITNELLYVLATAGIEPDKASDTQLHEAINKIAVDSFVLDIGDTLLPESVFDDVPSYENGGPTGNMNVQAQALLNRTVYLLQKISYLEKIQGDNDKTAAHLARQLSAGSPISISCYGDSTMWGASVGNLGVQDPNNAPLRLGTALTLIYNITITPNNRAISGSTLRQMMEGTDGSGSSFESKISSGGVDSATQLIYCNHGINDSQLNGSIEQYRLDLVEFVRVCRSRGKVPILVTPNPNPPYSIIDEIKSKRLYNFVRVMRSVAAKMGVDIVDQYDYFTQSYGHYTPIEIVPDGAHLASFAYSQAGFNLAIPLLSARAIGNAGDHAGLSNVSYYDNFTVNRQLQNRQSSATEKASRVGQTLSAERPSNPSVLQGFNYPVVLTKSQSVISFIGLQWADAANCSAQDNGGNLGSFYQQKQYGDQNYLDWDSECKFYGKRLAGLHIFGALFNPSDLGLGKGISFSGVAIPSLTTQSITSATAGPDPYTKSVADNGDTLVLPSVLLDANGVLFSDKKGSPVLSISISSGHVVVDLWKNGSIVSSNTTGTSVTVQQYPVSIRINSNSVDVSVGLLGLSMTTSTKLPNIKPASAAVHYSIVPTYGV
jgi:hypothetical protein